MGASGIVARTAAAKNREAAVGPFSMTDEEGDLVAFQDYLGALDADALWDVSSHLDPERYPRRHEALGREIARRRLFFVTPYTGFELRLRGLALVCLSLALLAALLRLIGSWELEVPTYVRLPFFTDLAVGGPRAARLVCPLALLAAGAGAAATLFAAVAALFLLARRRIRADIAAVIGVCALATVFLLRFAAR